MSTDDVPVLVYAGQYTEAVFLKTLLGGSGIEAASDDSVRKRGLWGEVRVYVAHRDHERARAIVDDFKCNGTKTPYGGGTPR